MEITGFSSDFVVDASFPTAMRSFVGASLERWPTLHYCGEPFDTSRLDSWELPYTPDEDDADIVTFSSGQEMEDFWEENGYSLNDAGEGPYSVFFKNRRRRLIANTSHPRTSDSDDARCLDGVRLLMSEFFTVSLVTPRDPNTDPFSARVLADFTDAFARGARQRM